MHGWLDDPYPKGDPLGAFRSLGIAQKRHVEIETDHGFGHGDVDWNCRMGVVVVAETEVTTGATGEVEVRTC